MRNHDEKLKDMIESVLPSTARKSARARRRGVHQQARARQRLAVAAMRGCYDDARVDFREGHRKSDLRWMVLDRRSADNVGALTRWAVATVAADPTLRDAPLHVQVAYFASILPTDLIGRHAAQHIRWALEYAARGSYWAERRARSAAEADERSSALIDALRRILSQGRHGDLNDALRQGYADHAADGTSAVEVRYLLGWHDVEAFAAVVVRIDWVRGVVAALAVS